MADKPDKALGRRSEDREPGNPIQNLAAGFDRVAGALDAVSSKLDQQAKRRRLLGIAVGIVLLIGLLIIIDARNTSKENREILSSQETVLEKVEGIGNYLINCTTPGPTIPTVDKPLTGNACYDELRSGRGQTNTILELHCVNILLHGRAVSGEAQSICAPYKKKMEELGIRLG